MTIPVRPSPSHARPMRSSVEGLNQEIEKLVLQPDQPHTCRPETNLVRLALLEKVEFRERRKMCLFLMDYIA